VVWTRSTPAGAEVDFDERHETTAEALAAMLAPSSGARWTASDADGVLRGQAGFEMVCHVGTALVVRRI
jgi:hypothetical protein